MLPHVEHCIPALLTCAGGKTNDKRTNLHSRFIGKVPLIWSLRHGILEEKALGQLTVKNMNQLVPGAESDQRRAAFVGVTITCHCNSGE